MSATITSAQLGPLRDICILPVPQLSWANWSWTLGGMHGSPNASPSL